jgi:hypothetical protein
MRRRQPEFANLLGSRIIQASFERDFTVKTVSSTRFRNQLHLVFFNDNGQIFHSLGSADGVSFQTPAQVGGTPGTSTPFTNGATVVAFDDGIHVITFDSNFHMCQRIRYDDGVKPPYWSDWQPIPKGGPVITFPDNP